MKCPFVIKVCSKCKRILVANNMNFANQKRGKWGLRADCKMCKCDYRKKRYQNNKGEELKRSKKWREDNPEYKKKYYKENKELIREYNKKWYEENKEKIKEQKKKYIKEHKEEISEYEKKWRKENPNKVFNKHNRRRGKLESQGKGITKEQWLEMMKFFDWKCAYSGEKLTNGTRTIDHIVPLDNGGVNEIWNCVPMLRNYNSSKHTSDMEEWYKEQEYFSKERLQKIYEWIEYAYEKWGDINDFE